MIRFENVCLEYERGRAALEGLSFEIAAGSFTFLTGHSGAGKSSLLRLIARLERPTSGEIVVSGIHYATLKRRQEPMLRRQMGMIFQDNQLLPDRSVFDNVALPLIIGGYAYRDIVTRVTAALQHVGLEQAHDQAPGVLSGGEQQRVGIARALVARPRLLLADEPTGNLDAAMSRDIMELLLQFHRAGVTVVLATHDETLLRDYPLARLELHAGRHVSAAPSAQATRNTGAQNHRQTIGP